MAKKIIIAQFKSGQAGNDGKDGKDGTIVNFPIGDNVVSHIGQNRNGVLVSTLLDELFYVDLTINSFNTPVTVFEIGTVLSSLTFNWTLSKDIVNQSITGTGVTAGQSIGNSLRAFNVSLDNITTDTVFFLNVEDSDGIEKSANIAVDFLKGVYVGKGIIPASLNSAFILSLNKKLQGNRQRTFSTTTGTNEFIWAAYPVSYGLGLFRNEGFLGGFEDPQTVSFTNGLGHTEDYYVYRSSNSGLGTILTEIL